MSDPLKPCVRSAISFKSSSLRSFDIVRSLIVKICKSKIDYFISRKNVNKE